MLTAVKAGRVVSIRELAQKKWRSSGISDKLAKKLKLTPLTGSQVSKLGKFYPVGALKIPYWNLDGRPTKFFRLRYLEQLPGAAGIVEKPRRYDQLPVMQEVYYPPILKRSWREISKDATTKLLLTEGELKADVACAAGFCCAALGGVYSFMSSKRGIGFLPSLEEFVWRDRQVVIVYDNDVSTKPEVMRAQRELALALVARGARVQFGHVPPGPAKGLDDLLVARGREALEHLVNHAEPFAEGEALWKLNEEVVFIKEIDSVVERESGLLMDPYRFTQHIYANRYYLRQVEKGSGKRAHVSLEKEKLAPRWLEWEQRAELRKIVYTPGAPKIHEGNWNTWDGWGVEPKRGDVGPWTWLLDFLFHGDPTARSYFERWCAYPIQNPGAKLYTACVIWSRVKRLGKSMTALALKKIYGKNAEFVDSKQLKSGFNTWARNRQLVIGEEITAGEARVDADYMKFLVTTPTFTINAKYQPEYAIENHTNFLFLSNHPDALFLEDGDRRYMVHGVNQERPAERARYEQCDAWLKGDGPAFLMDHLLRLNLRDFNPREHAPETRSKWEMVLVTKSDVALWVQMLREDSTTALKSLGERTSRECDLFTADQLMRAFDPQDRGRGKLSLSALGRAMANAGFRHVNDGMPLHTCTGLHRVYAVRNTVAWEQATRRELRAHYDQFHGFIHAGAVR